MAEGVGFEPTAQGFAPRTAFPVPHLRPLGHPSWIAPKELAEGRGFEPPRDLLGPYPISSRTPSTGLGHPSASTVWNAHGPRDDHGGDFHDLFASPVYPSGDKPGSKGLPGYATLCRGAGKTCSVPATPARLVVCPSRWSSSWPPSPC